MLVFTAFYSLELPFIFYRCQQLGAHMKCNHFSVTNCHHLCYSLDITCAWSLRNLCVNFIYTISVSLSLSYFYRVHTNTHTLFYNNNSGSSYCMSIIFWRAMKQEETWDHATRQKYHDKHSLVAHPQSQFSGFRQDAFQESFANSWRLTMRTFSGSWNILYFSC